MKTIKSAAIEWIENESISRNSYDVERAFFAGASFVQRWIPVEEELPTEQGLYLVKCKTSYPKNCDVVVAEFYEDNQTFYYESSDCPINDATHWRPITI